MPTAFFTLIAFQLLGESLRIVSGVPIPGPVIGMFLLTAALVLRGRRRPTDPLVSGPLSQVAGAMLTYLGLLFVPAGVGVITQLDLLREQWLPIAAGLAGSATLGLVVTGLVMHRMTRQPAMPGPVAP